MRPTVGASFVAMGTWRRFFGRCVNFRMCQTPITSNGSHDVKFEIICLLKVGNFPVKSQGAVQKIWRKTKMCVWRGVAYGGHWVVKSNVFYSVWWAWLIAFLLPSPGYGNFFHRLRQGVFRDVYIVMGMC